MRNNVVKCFIIFLCTLIFVACGSNGSSDDSNKFNQIQVNEKSNETLENNSTETSSEGVAVNEQEEGNKFPQNWYVNLKEYGIAPSELINKDLERPESNEEWTKNLVIKYPQVYNMEDYEKEKRINEILYKEAMNYHDVLESRDYIEYSVDYEIKEANKGLLSILFLGEVDDQKALNRFAYGVTLDINSEKLLKLDDFLVINKLFIEDHLYSDFNVVENNFNDITENTPFVKSFIEKYDQSPHTKDFYVMGDNIGIIIPTNDSMGYILIQGSLKKE